MQAHHGLELLQFLLKILRVLPLDCFGQENLLDFKDGAVSLGSEAGIRVQEETIFGKKHHNHGLSCYSKIHHN